MPENCDGTILKGACQTVQMKGQREDPKLHGTIWWVPVAMVYHRKKLAEVRLTAARLGLGRGL